VLRLDAFPKDPEPLVVHVEDETPVPDRVPEMLTGDPLEQVI
jgi:hypothetical protein